LDVIIPDEYWNEMASLCEYNPESSWTEVKEVLQSELGEEWEKKFSEFNIVPMKVGSIA